MNKFFPFFFSGTLLLNYGRLRNLVSRDLQITVVHSDGTSQQVTGFNRENFFTGHVVGKSFLYEYMNLF